MTSSARQVLALLGLRWRLLRSWPPRAAVVLSALLLGWLAQSLAASVSGLPAPAVETAAEVAPTAFLAFAVLAFVAPLASGGGQDLVPQDQLLAYPVRPGAVFLGGLLLAPLNLVWVVQLLGLVVLTAAVAAGGRGWLAAAACAAWVVLLTVLGQALAWLVAGLRAHRVGRVAVWSAGAALLLAGIAAVRSGAAGRVVELSPAPLVVEAVEAGADGRTGSWLLVVGVLLALGAAGAAAGVRACAWALRRPLDALSGAGPVRRRTGRRSAFRELVATDRASVWRAPALRRAGGLLLVGPGLAALAAGVQWESLVVLPGLVAAGAGLLFGVNAFALDASGAVWLSSLPHRPSLVARAKALVLAETVLVAVAASMLLGSLRAVGTPSAALGVGMACGALACTSVVVAGCMRASVLRAHRAPLVGPRDAVLPPGALVAASIRLSFPAATAGVLVAAAASTGVWWLPAVMAVPPVALAGLSLARTARRYGDPSVRAAVVQAVAFG